MGFAVDCRSAVEMQQDGRRSGCSVGRERADVHYSAFVALVAG